jgi:predicted amidohydrolase
MEKLKASAVQFEHKSRDKAYNLSVIDQFSKQAAEQGSKVVAFHECCITGYTFTQNLSKQEMLELAEYLPESSSIKELTNISREHDVVILAGLFEKDRDNRLFNTYICVHSSGLVAKHRKIHPFINPWLSPGEEYTVFDLDGWKCGILICYDNNIIENVRATKLMGADIIFMPHVTMCTPSSRPGAGFVDPGLWENREEDPTSLRIEFDGLKGRAWLMKWLPARAFDNAVYLLFANPIGMDHDQLKNGCSMIIDPFGDILAECRDLGDDICSALLIPDKLTKAGGNRYLNARKPFLYRDIIGQHHESQQNVSWVNKNKN